jgi:DNA-binding HxlR family transcriptional regulator
MKLVLSWYDLGVIVTNRRARPTHPHGQVFLTAISERWNYLIMREVFYGVNRFGELRRALGISANILTSRLNDLIDLGLLEKQAYRSDKPWYEYQLSQAARELVVPALLTVTRWAERHHDDAAVDTRLLLHTVCGSITHPYLACSTCHQPIDADALEPLPDDEVARPVGSASGAN